MSAEEAVEVIEDISELPINAGRYVVGLVMVGVGAAAMGGVLGWVLCEKRLKQRYEEQASLEIEEAREHYKARYKTDEYATPQSAAESRGASVTPSLDKAARALVDYQGGPEEAETPAGEDDDSDTLEVTIDSETTNIFEQARIHRELTDEEKDARTPTAPFIIDYEEFMEADSNYEQKKLTYYEGDDILTDETDEPIPELERTVGRANLQFGKGSGDVDTVFIRNDRMKMDFEVARSEGLYSHEVAGFQHSDSYDRRGEKRPIRKFRGGDE